MTSEKRFENKVKDWLKSEGIYPAGTEEQRIDTPVCGWYVKIWGGGLQKRGIPDLLMNVNGVFIAVELKSEKGTPSDLQRKNLELINRGKGIGLILYPEGFSNFQKIVKGVKECNSAIPALSVLKAVHSSTTCAIWKG